MIGHAIIEGLSVPVLLPVLLSFAFLLYVRRVQRGLLLRDVDVNHIATLLQEVAVAFTGCHLRKVRHDRVGVRVSDLLQERANAEVLQLCDRGETLLDRADLLCGRVVLGGFLAVSFLVSTLMWALDLNNRAAVGVDLGILAFLAVAWFMVSDWELQLVAAVKILKGSQGEEVLRDFHCAVAGKGVEVLENPKAP